MNAPVELAAVLDADRVRTALAGHHANGPYRALADALALPAEGFTRQAAEFFGFEYLDMEQLRAATADFEVIRFVEATQRMCAMLVQPDGVRLIAITDPLDSQLHGWIVQKLRLAGIADARWGLCHADDLRAFLALAERSLRAMDTVAVSEGGAGGSSESALSMSIADISSSSSPIVRLVDSTIHDALKSAASDIHLETQRTGLVIKYRLDGVLEVVRRVDGLDAAHQVLSRIKVVSELDISERRIPQDGRFKVTADGREIDLRVSIMPNLLGEDAVLRILDRQHLAGEARQIRLENLGFEADALEFIRELSALPYGMLLATGPTGSGKTTTLYAVLSEINTGLDKIVTIEDPVEYQVNDVLQIPVNEKKGLTFARGLRSILRHDPDKIMVGEIRDPETAQIAVQAALTGHQVFTTVHANNVFDVIGRFANMGVDTYSFVSALNGILAQRLIRLTCTHCAKHYNPRYSDLAASKITVPKLVDAGFRRGLGCAHCRGTGYKGRKAIAETLRISDELRDLLAERAPLSQIKAAAKRQGYRSLREAAAVAVTTGMTTLEEINRVTPVS